MSANGVVVWSSESGWVDDGPEVTVYVDVRGRLVIEPQTDVTPEGVLP